MDSQIAAVGEPLGSTHSRPNAVTIFLLAVAFLGHASAATFRPLVMGKRAVVAAGHPLVAEAGLRILHQGGNAIDAGVASVFAAAVVEMDGFGLGGECPILIKPADGAVIAINGDGIAPALATVDYYEHLAPDDPRVTDVASISKGIIPAYGPLSAIVPSAVDSLLVTLEKYGRMRLADVIQPAIELAQGFPIDDRLVREIARFTEVLEKWPSARAIYLPGGRLPRPGDLFVQADLAATLRSLAETDRQNASRGRVPAIEAVREYFYRGPIARRVSEYCRRAGCLLREEDFAAYRAKVEGPLVTTYRGVDVYKVGFWSQSPVFLENLNLLEGFDLVALRHNSPAYIHLVVEAMKLGFADRDAYYGDPEFSQIPRQLVSKEYAAIRRPLIDPAKASDRHIPGDPIRMSARATEEFVRSRLSNRNSEHTDTTCVNVIDTAGNMFSATPSGGWVPPVIAGDTGIQLSQRAQAFVLTPGHPNQLQPHKRPRITLTPTLAIRDKKPWLAFSTPCGDGQDQTLLQIFLNVLEFGMNPQEAIEAPRFNSAANYSSFDVHRDHPLVLQIENRIPGYVLDRLGSLGHKLELQGEWGNQCNPTMVEYDPLSGVIRGGADVRGERYALGW
jgi:gamma-glutamyltranspeptidase / glutathione hydrolase